MRKVENLRMVENSWKTRVIGACGRSIGTLFLDFEWFAMDWSLFTDSPSPSWVGYHLCEGFNPRIRSNSFINMLLLKDGLVLFCAKFVVNHLCILKTSDDDYNESRECWTEMTISRSFGCLATLCT